MLTILQLGHESRWTPTTFGMAIDRQSVVLNAASRKPYLAAGSCNIREGEGAEG